MDELDKILLQHLPDTGLCERSKVKQAERRAKLKAALLRVAGAIHDQAFLHGSGGNPAHLKGLMTKEGGRLNTPDMAMIGNNHGPELIIDEMQFNEQDKPKFPSGGIVGNPFDKRKNIPPSIPEEEMKRITAFLNS